MKRINRQISSVCVALMMAMPLAATTVLVGCAGGPNQRTAGQYIDDKTITYRVKNALGDNPEYKFDNVNVTTYRGTVQLSGFVTNDSQKSKAEDIARQVQGVANVENNISIKPGTNVSQK